MPIFVSFTQLGSPPVSSVKSLLEMLSRAVWRGECGTSLNSSSSGDRDSVMLQCSLPHPQSCHLPTGIGRKVAFVKTQVHYYSALIRKGILAQATTWMNLENISEISKTQTEKY